MNRTVLVVAVLASCTGNKSTVPTDTLGSTHWERSTGPRKADRAKADATLPFRAAFQDPGGMWLPSQMPLQAETFKKLGVELDVAQLANPVADPLAATVLLDGCTGAFVSRDGLIVTNHHCVQRGLAQRSTPDANLVETGFLAKTPGEEIPAGAGARVVLVQAITDVTKAMRGGLEDIKDPIARKEESEKRGKALVSTCEKDRAGIRCAVSKLFGGAPGAVSGRISLPRGPPCTSRIASESGRSRSGKLRNASVGAGCGRESGWKCPSNGALRFLLRKKSFVAC